VRPELVLSYDDAIHPIAGRCAACGAPMPSPPTDSRDNVDTVKWLSAIFLRHRELKHPLHLDADDAEGTL